MFRNIMSMTFQYTTFNIDISAIHVVLSRFYPDFIWISEKIWIKFGQCEFFKLIQILP